MLFVLAEYEDRGEELSPFIPIMSLSALQVDGEAETCDTRWRLLSTSFRAFCLDETEHRASSHWVRMFMMWIPDVCRAEAKQRLSREMQRVGIKWVREKIWRAGRPCSGRLGMVSRSSFHWVLSRNLLHDDRLREKFDKRISMERQ